MPRREEARNIYFPSSPPSSLNYDDEEGFRHMYQTYLDIRRLVLKQRREWIATTKAEDKRERKVRTSAAAKPRKAASATVAQPCLRYAKMGEDLRFLSLTQLSSLRSITAAVIVPSLGGPVPAFPVCTIDLGQAGCMLQRMTDWSARRGKERRLEAGGGIGGRERT